MAEATTDAFLSPDDQRHFALLVEGSKVYVCREFLACWSPVFQKIFFPEGAPFKQPEGGIPMKDKKLDEFLIFLRAICPNSTTMIVNESNVAVLVAYADEYDVGVLTERCVKFIGDQLKHDVAAETLIDYLRLATTYNLKNLQEETLPLVAKLHVDKIQAAHETLPLAVLAAVYHMKTRAAADDDSVSISRLPENSFWCAGCGSTTCSISKGASSCCNKRVIILATVVAQIDAQCSFTCARCSKPCVLGGGANYRGSLCCGWGMFIKRKSDVSINVGAAPKDTHFTTDLLNRKQ